MFPLRRFVEIIVLAAFLAASVPPSTGAPAEALPSYEDWKAACSRLPANRVLKGRLPAKELLPLRRFKDFDAVLTPLLAQFKEGPLSLAENWVGEMPRDFFDLSKTYFDDESNAAPGRAARFQPYVQTLSVPNGSEVFFRADLHGDIRSLLADLNWLNENRYLRGFSTRTNFYMVFLGDYTDRGSYGMEVLYTLYRLKMANPERVFLGRGNHEEATLQRTYGFIQEARGKYGAEFDEKKVIRAYDFLPVSLYVGSGRNFIECHHGGMDPGFDPRPLLQAPGPMRFRLLGPLQQRQFFNSHPDWYARADPGSRSLAERVYSDFVPVAPTVPLVLGFMWNDFSILTSERQFTLDPGRAFVYGQRATQYLLRQASTPEKQIQAVFRGHQQSSALNPMMRRLIASRGVFRHWQTSDSQALLNADIAELGAILEHEPVRPIPSGSVWTFNVSPDSVYGEECHYTFDTFGILKTAAEFADWRLQVVNVTVN